MNKLFIGSDEGVAPALELLDTSILLCGDTETSGLDPYTCKLWSIQIGDQNTGLLFPYNALSEDSRNLLRKFLKDKEIIFHQAKFDLKFLHINGFDIGRAYCTKETEKMLFAGKYFTFSLKDVLFRRFQIAMDKEVREVFYNSNRNEKSEFQLRVDQYGEWGAWSKDTIDYALGDIEYLHEIYFAQQEDLKTLGMGNVGWLENHLVPVVAKMENRGVWLDSGATKKFLSRVSLRRDELKQSIFGLLEKNYNISWRREYARRIQLQNSWKSSHAKIVAESNKSRVEGDKRKKTDEAKQMVADSLKKKPFSSIIENNPFSPTSPIKLQQALTETVGFPVTTTGKEWLEENIYLHEAIADLVEFRKFDKLCQFCELTEDINPVTGLIHANFNQNGTKSGRFSCDNPNLQNIPAKTDEAKEFRALFRAKEGYKFVGADLAGIELVILAYFSGEDILIDAINKDLDLHCFTMSLFLNCPYDAVVALKKHIDTQVSPDLLNELVEARKRFEGLFSLPELSKKGDIHSWVKLLRDYTKTLSYGLAYGLSEFGLSRKFHCSYEDAKVFIAKFFLNYPNLKKFLHIQEELSYERKYAVNPLGRRRWFYTPKMKSYEEIEKDIIKSLDKQKRIWESVTNEEWELLVQEAIQEEAKALKGKINSIKRQAGNFFPQSLCAEMIKLAMVRFDKVFQTEDKNEGLNLTIHDEIIANVRDENTKLAKKLMEESMVYAVNKFMPNIKISVEAIIMDRWRK